LDELCFICPYCRQELPHSEVKKHLSNESRKLYDEWEYKKSYRYKLKQTIIDQFISFKDQVNQKLRAYPCPSCKTPTFPYNNHRMLHCRCGYRWCRHCSISYDHTYCRTTPKKRYEKP